MIGRQGHTFIIIELSLVVRALYHNEIRLRYKCELPHHCVKAYKPHFGSYCLILMIKKRASKNNLTPKKPIKA